MQRDFPSEVAEQQLIDEAAAGACPHSQDQNTKCDSCQELEQQVLDAAKEVAPSGPILASQAGGQGVLVAENEFQRGNTYVKEEWYVRQLPGETGEATGDQQAERRPSGIQLEERELQHEADEERRRQQQFLEHQRIEQNMQEERQRYIEEQRRKQEEDQQVQEQERRRRASSLLREQEQLKGKLQEELLHEQPTQAPTLEYNPPKHERTVGNPISNPSSRMDLLHRGGRLSADKLAVIIAGWPNDLAISSAKACVRHGYKLLPFGLCLEDCNDDRVNISEIGTFPLMRLNDSQAQSMLQEHIRLAKAQGLFPVVVDTSENEMHLHMYQALQVPFIFESHEQGEKHERAIRETEKSRTFALISTKMDKRVAAVDEFFADWAKRFPGLFATTALHHHRVNNEFDVSFKTSDPEHKVNRDVLDAMSDLLNKDVNMDSNVDTIPPVERQERPNVQMKDHIYRELVLKNARNTTVFKFEEDVNGKYECGEGVAESVAFLAQKTQEYARPRVFDILDVAQHSRFLGW